MIYTGDCIEVMQTLDPDSIDAVVTDPPYGLEFMGKEWDRFKHTGFSQRFHRPKDEGRTFTNESGHMFDNAKVLPRLSAGPAFQEWCEAWGRAALRVTKPGGYLLVFGGTRTHHRLVCGLEDAGWIIRDELDWIYASGFPKGKANLKPAHEPIVLARKPGPLRPLAIDACRIGTGDDKGVWPVTERPETRQAMAGGPMAARTTDTVSGRWPSNVLLSDPELFDEPNPDVVGSGAIATTRGPVTSGKAYEGTYGNIGTMPEGYDLVGYGDTGGYSRFFIVPKAARSDREQGLNGTNGERVNVHPTVKPTALMRHLVKLVTPVGGTVLDCFLGSGSTALAAETEGFAWIGIEKEPEYVAIAEARLNGVQRGIGL